MCLSPVMAWYNNKPNPSGKRSLHFKPSWSDTERSPLGDLTVPCGRCLGCLADRSRVWHNRLSLELITNPVATFITLTYDDAHLPSSPSKRHIQLFLKKLRNVSRDFGINIPNLKYFIVSERGDRKGRIHYHGIIYGLDILNDPKWKTYIHHYTDGYPVFVSDLFTQIWSNGFTSVDVVTPNSIRYISAYIYSPDNLRDGVRLCSRRLGCDYFVDFRSHDIKLYPSAYQLFNNGFVVLGRGHDNHKVYFPKYLDRYYELVDEGLYNALKSRRKHFVTSSHCRSDSVDYEEFLKLQNSKLNQRRKIHHDD